ncbi:MAG: DUF4214 domain-containing protein [Candidatus Bathyarchaeota archaeon]
MEINIKDQSINRLNKIEVIVNSIYRETLKRDADPGGLAHYTEQLKTGCLTEDQLREILFDSEEYKNKNPLLG